MTTILENAVYFTFDKIITELKPNKEGQMIEKKKTIGMNIDHSKITKQNYKGYVKKNDTAFAILTGKKSNITVVDYDNKDTFKRDNDKFHFLENNHYVVESKNGFHVYFTYDERLKQTQCEKEQIDVRNDGGLIFAPPTKYILLDGTVAEYKYISGTVKSVETDYYNYLMENIYAPIKTEKKITTKNNVVEKTTNNKNTDELHKLLKCLKSDRYDDYGDWINIGMIMKNEGFSCDDFHNFSSQSLKYNKDYCNEKWNSFKTSGLTMGTLHYYAKNDNFELYCNSILNINKQNLYVPLFTSSLIAEYFKLLYGDKFVYTEGQLYIFNGVYWKTDDKNNSLISLFVKNEFFNKLLSYALNNIKLNNENETITDEERDAKHKKLLDFQYNINTLKKITVRKSFVEDIIIHITNNDVKFDKNPYLFAFNNKIYNLETGKFEIPNPLDYISITCGYDYNDNIDITKIDDLQKEIVKILPDEEIRNFYLTILSTGLSGLKQQNLFIATGVGGNGKSVLDSLMMECVGKYGYKIPNTILLNPIKEGANPQVFNINNKRFCLATEPTDKQKICCSTIKELTGDKTLNVRDNYSSSCGIELNMSLIMECNNLPLLDESTDAMLRRVIAIPFNSKFVNAETYESINDDENKKHIYLGNPYYSSNKFHNEYKQLFFMILIKHFEDFKNNNYTLQKTPVECKKITMEYMMNSDVLFDWFDNTFEKDCDSPPIKLKDIYETYKYSDFYSNMSKNDKRIWNMKYFNEKVEKNLFLKPFIKRRDEYVNKNIKLSSDSIIGWKLKIKDTIVTNNDVNE